MPRKATGKAPGRPRIVRTADGARDPSHARPTPKARAALKAELAALLAQRNGKAELGRAFIEDDHWPVAKAPHIIARQAGVTAAAVRKWRRDGVFRIVFMARALELYPSSARLERRKGPPKAIRSPSLRQLMATLHPHWPAAGFVLSPINGRKYQSLETYAKHLRANGCIPYAGPEE